MIESSTLSSEQAKKTKIQPRFITIHKPDDVPLRKNHVQQNSKDEIKTLNTNKEKEESASEEGKQKTERG